MRVHIHIYIYTYDTFIKTHVQPNPIEHEDIASGVWNAFEIDFSFFPFFVFWWTVLETLDIAAKAFCSSVSLPTHVCLWHDSFICIAWLLHRTWLTGFFIGHDSHKYACPLVCVSLTFVCMCVLHVCVAWMTHIPVWGKRPKFWFATFFFLSGWNRGNPVTSCESEPDFRVVCLRFCAGWSLFFFAIYV